MRKTKLGSRIISAQIDVSVKCNKCGEGYERDKYGINNGELNDIELHQIKFGRFGNGSRFGNQCWDFDVCDSCLGEWAKTFKHVPSGFMQSDNWILGFEEHQKVFDNWKETGEWDLLHGKTYDELSEINGYFGIDYLNEYIVKHFPDRKLFVEDEYEASNPFN